MAIGTTAGDKKRTKWYSNIAIEHHKLLGPWVNPV
jgi:hypothetical protein